MKIKLAMIKDKADILGLLFLGGGATISRCPLLNILASGKNIPLSVLDIVYCQGDLSEGNNKYGILFCNLFLKQIKEIDRTKKLSGIVLFDGALNVKLAGRILKVNYPRFKFIRAVKRLGTAQDVHFSTRALI